MIRTVSLWAAALAALVITFVGTGHAFAAAAAPTADSSISDLFSAIVDAFRGGHRVAAGALTVFAALALAKRYWTTGVTGRWLHSDLGGTATVFGMALAGAVAASTANAPWSWSILWTAGGVGVAAIGGYAAAKAIFKAIEGSKWYATAPAWFKSAIDILTWLVDKPDAVKEAQAAGAAAVQANPAQGADGVAGPATKF